MLLLILTTQANNTLAKINNDQICLLMLLDVYIAVFRFGVFVMEAKNMHSEALAMKKGQEGVNCLLISVSREKLVIALLMLITGSENSSSQLIYTG